MRSVCEIPDWRGYFIDIVLFSETDNTVLALGSFSFILFLDVFGFLATKFIYWREFYLLMGDIYIETTTHSDQILCLKYLLSDSGKN